jgi:hypothetical protein
MLQVYLVPTQGAQFLRTKTMAVRKEYRRCIPRAIPSSFPCGLDQPLRLE